ncbi:hypothetical protein ORI89_17940 [Sphingobacterium sp. UT-1RO-CII-1]|uniref:hypothetical protein n=1 Tax=Sphingobacterium sp. UT-1RO-CII-1 TaxID=2995225 RepID=UPI00227C8037|nr:hypothetical protein [Sphingobacterium sp. UT-1RO-CII-1]MCY4781542.1 hypothetical protein [Sphingobacterium sp. UT-1RO-CII-1]
MITIKKSGLRALKITLFTLLIISSLAIIVKAMNSNSEVKVVGKTTVTTTTWYFTGGEHDDPLDPNNYSLTPPASACDHVKEQICEINAPNVGGKPDMAAPVSDKPTETVYQQINDAQLSLTEEGREPTLNETVTAFRSILP